MTKEKAVEVSIELAKCAIESPSGNLSVYPNKNTAEDVADFIKTLSTRLMEI